MKRILRKTLDILDHKERRQLFIFIVLNVVVSIADIVSLALLVLLVGYYAGSASSVASVIYAVFGKGSLLPISVFFVLFVLKSIAGYRTLTAQYQYAYRVASRISKENLKSYLTGNYTDYVHTDSSVNVKKILYQPIEFCHYVLSGFQQIMTEVILSFFAVLAILAFNPRLFLLLVLVLSPPVVMIALFTRKKLKQARLHAKTHSEKTLQHLHEALSGFIESNIFDKDIFFVERFSGNQRKMAQYLADIQSAQGAPSRLIEIFAVLGLFALVLAGRFTGGVVDFISIGAFMAAAYKIIPGIVKIANLSGQIKTYEYTVDDLAKHYPGKATLAAKQGCIERLSLRNISFSRDNKLILDNLSFELVKGDFVGISGASGRGKTTFVNLLLGFITPDSGEVTVNGVTVAPQDIRGYWESIAYSQQRPFLIHDSVLANITLSDNGIDKERLQSIADRTGLRDIDLNENVLTKTIRENGKNISGGQRQRIAVARALYKNADLVILDEPFSELDGASEKAILAHLQQLAGEGKMIIMITHNKDNLQYCNKTLCIG